MPIGSKGSPVFIAGRGLTPMPMVNLYPPFNQPSRYVISGVTKDSTGAALGGCEVEVYETVSGMIRGTTVSDAAGNYILHVTGNGVVAPSDGEAATVSLTFYVVAYKAGAPDVAGTTVNTLAGS